MSAAGVVPSDTDCEGGRDIVVRGFDGLKSPGDETGVLPAVSEGCCGFVADGSVL